MKNHTNQAQINVLKKALSQANCLLEQTAQHVETLKAAIKQLESIEEKPKEGSPVVTPTRKISSTLQKPTLRAKTKMEHKEENPAQLELVDATISVDEENGDYYVYVTHQDLVKLVGGYGYDGYGFLLDFNNESKKSSFLQELKEVDEEGHSITDNITLTVVVDQREGLPVLRYISG